MSNKYKEATDQQEAADQEEVIYLDALGRSTQETVVEVFTIFDYFHHNFDSETSIELTRMVFQQRLER